MRFKLNTLDVNWTDLKGKGLFQGFLIPFPWIFQPWPSCGHEADPLYLLEEGLQNVDIAFWALLKGQIHVKMKKYKKSATFLLFQRNSFFLRKFNLSIARYLQS